MSSIITLRRQLRIKTGAINRLSKEHESYVKEITDHKTKLDKLIEENAEEWDIKNARNMLAESQKMAANAQTMVLRNYNELKDVVEAVEAEESITEDDPGLLAAKATLQRLTVAEGG